MLSPDHIRFVVNSFRDPTDGSSLKSRELILMLVECSPEPFSRKQFTPGHITCTGLVVAPDRERLLLVHHRRLNRWLLPGGHVEPEDEFAWDSARREVIEETSAELVADAAPMLAGMDVHGIPARGEEPYHLHHDLIFAFRAADDRVLCSPESRELAWCMPGEFDRFALPPNVRLAYQRAVNSLKQ